MTQNMMVICCSYLIMFGPYSNDQLLGAARYPSIDQYPRIELILEGVVYIANIVNCYYDVWDI